MCIRDRSSTTLLALTTSPSSAVNKCVAETGLVVYQSAPCPATAKGSELTLQKTAPVSTVAPADAVELKHIQQTANALELSLIHI